MDIRNKINHLLEKAIVILMVTLVVDVTWQVLSRYLNKLLAELNTGIPSQLYTFTDELAGFLLIWVGLIGAAYVTGKGEHLAIDLLVSKSKDKMKKNIEIAIRSFIILFAVCVMIIGGIWLVYTRFHLNQVSAAMQIPLGYVYLVLPISGVLITYYSFHDIILKLQNR